MRKGPLIFWTLIIAIAATRLTFSFNVEEPDLGTCIKQTVSGTGAIQNEPEAKETGQIFIIRAHELRAAGSLAEASCATDILLRVKTKLHPQYTYGDTVSFQGKISKPFNFRSDDGREFDYEGYLAKDHVFYEIKSATIELEKAGSRNLAAILYQIKRGFVHNLRQVLGEPHAALAAGLVVGEKSALGADLLDDFRTVGLIHIVVLSGYNITIVADALRRLLSFLPRTWGIIAGALGIVAFGILVGGGATVVRSCCMSGVALTADLIRRDYSVRRGLFLAGLLMIIQNPLILLNDPSFQLSFLATFGLIVFSEPIEKRLSFITEKFGLRGIVASSLATQLFVSPFLVYMMGSISIIGFISNILVLPFVPLTMLAVAIAGIGGFVWAPASTAAGWLAHLLLSYELKIVEVSADVPLASIHFPLFSGWIVVGIYMLYVVGLTLAAKRKRFSAVSQFTLAKKSST